MKVYPIIIVWDSIEVRFKGRKVNIDSKEGN